MILIKKTLILWLCAILVSFHLLNTSSSAVAGTTSTKPQSVSSPEEDIPNVRETDSSHKTRGKWLWIILGILLLGGAVVAAAGVDGSNGDDDTPTTGEHEFTW